MGVVSMKKSLSDIALEIQTVRAEIKSLKEYRDLAANKSNYLAIIKASESDYYSRDAMYRYKRLDSQFKTPILKIIDAEIKLQNHKILALETEIKDGTVHAIMEPTELAEPIEHHERGLNMDIRHPVKKSFFSKLFKTG